MDWTGCQLYRPLQDNFLLEQETINLTFQDFNEFSGRLSYKTREKCTKSAIFGLFLVL